MSDEQRGPVSMNKTAGTGDTPGTDGMPPRSMPPRPQRITYLVWSLIAAGILGVVGGLTFYTAHDWLLTSFEQNNAKAKGSAHKTHAQLLHEVSATQLSTVLGAIIVFLALSFVANAVWRGRYWARWGVIGLWVLSTFTRQVASPISLLAIAAKGEPILVRAVSFLSAAAFLIAVVLSMFRDVAAYFAANKPIRQAPAPSIPRTGRFGGMAPPANDNTAASKATLSAQDALNPGRVDAPPPHSSLPRTSPDRMRSKQRVTADTRGPEQTGVRAKSGKSRRTGS